MKKKYNAPVIEYTSAVRCGFLCTSGTDTSGTDMMNTGGGGTGTGTGSDGWSAPRRRVF